ncbi:hypothetical protein [Lactobacillus apis]|uniref:hypothetical protein n=1 Tax=Lactobacillus apis TaxID=303541 RepID=UPI0013A5583B|nr:hypothetical protein [Lactobacillus apis]
MHTSPYICAPAIAKLPKGVQKNDDALQVVKRLWLRQPRASGYGYIVGGDKCCKVGHF